MQRVHSVRIDGALLILLCVVGIVGWHVTSLITTSTPEGIVSEPTPCTDPSFQQMRGWYIPIVVGGRSLQGLVDTGASNTLVHACILDEIAQQRKAHFVTTTYSSLADARIVSTNKWVVPIALVNGEERDVHVSSFENLAAGVIIGRDVLKLYEASIDFQNVKITIHNTPVTVTET